jgi:hypothetical protein
MTAQWDHSLDQLGISIKSNIHRTTVTLNLPNKLDNLTASKQSDVSLSYCG